jgi:tetratricopeptide (TPR) repeat protein/tRNA A-37 threonylcarbamoyl transferase component Bud32
MAARTISHFEIGEWIGEGGIGVVYKGRDVNLDRPVAIKFLHARLLDSEEAVRRFRREARVLSNLNHPNVATVYEVGEEDGQQFIVLEYLPGGSLSSKLRDLRHTGLMLSIRQVVETALELAEGVSYAHRQGIIHRDIKPANVLCSIDGKLKITDFGLAKFAQSVDSTVATRIEGTISYMSPEQIRGGAADVRSDIYSFGVTIFEAAAGEKPYTGPNDVAVMHSILHDAVPSLRSRRPDVPFEFDHLIRRAMAKDPDERLARMETVVAELLAIRDRSAGAQEATIATRDDSRTLPVETTSVRKRHRMPWRRLGLAILVLLLAGAAAGASKVWSMRCLVAHGWFDECVVPLKEKHVGVLKFRVAGQGDERLLAAGMREYSIGQLSRLARFEPALCVHPVEERSRQQAVNLSLEPKLTRAGATVTAGAELWDTRADLMLERMIPVEFRGASFQDQFSLGLAKILGIVVGQDARRALAAGSTGKREAFQAYITGLGHLALNQADQAGEAFRQAVVQDPYYPASYAGLAEAYRRRYHSSRDSKLMDMALEAATVATTRDSELPEGHVALGRVYYDLRQYGKATDELHRAVDLMPANSEVRYELVTAYIAAGKPDRSRTVAEKGVELHPNCWFAQHDLGSFFRILGQFQQAEACFRRVVKLAPNNAVAHSNLAATLYDQQKYAEAEQSWRRALELRPTSTAYINLGQLYVQTGCFQAAEQVLEAAAELKLDDFLAYGNLGEAFHLLPEYNVRERGMFHNALKLAEQARVNTPNDPQVVRMAAFYHARLGQKERAMEIIQQALDVAPDNIHTLYRAAFLYEISGERERAIPLVERVVKAGYQARELCTHPDLKGLRGDPRFRRILGSKCDAYQARAPESFHCPDTALTRR